MNYEQYKKHIETVIAKIYSKLELEKPQFEINRWDTQYNEGFYNGRLNAIEIVSRELLNKNGDELSIMIEVKVSEAKKWVGSKGTC